MPSLPPLIPELDSAEDTVSASIHQPSSHRRVVVLNLAFRTAASALPAGGHPLVTVNHGVAWVTQEGDRRDHILHAGQSIRLARHGRVAVQAIHRDGAILQLEDLTTA